MKRLTAVLIIIIMMGMTAGCIPRQQTTPGTDSQDQNAGQSGGADVEQKGGQEGEVHYGVYPGDKAYDFELEDLEGNLVKLSDFREKVVLLNFWQTGCSWCRKELPLANQLYEAYKDGDLAVLAVNIGESSTEVSAMAEEEGFLFRILLDRKTDVAKRYLISGLPTSFIITRSGIISAVHVGYMDYRQMEAYVQTAFRER